MQKRLATSGFTILESLVSFAILSVVLGATYVAIAQSVARQGRSSADIDLARVARGVLTEYAVTWPRMAANGTVVGRYRYVVTEQALEVPDSELLGGEIAFYEVEVLVELLDGASQPYRMVTAVMRRQTR